MFEILIIYFCAIVTLNFICFLVRYLPNINYSELKIICVLANIIITATIIIVCFIS